MTDESISEIGTSDLRKLSLKLENNVQSLGTKPMRTEKKGTTLTGDETILMPAEDTGKSASKREPWPLCALCMSKTHATNPEKFPHYRHGKPYCQECIIKIWEGANE